MSTIVYKDGIMVADTLVTASGRIEGYCKKILETKKLVCGAAGSLIAKQNFCNFLTEKKDDKEIIKMKEHAFDAIVVDKETGEVTLYD